MLLKAGNRRIHYDLLGPENGPVVCFAHALSSDISIWAEQVPPLLANGWRALRLDMRGHGGSDPLPGAYTMSELTGDVVLVLDALGLAKVHFVGLSIGGMIGQTFAIEHGHRLHSLMLCGTAPATIPGGWPLWEERFRQIKDAGSVAPLADATMERWFTPAFKQRRPGRWQQVRDTVAQTTPDGYIGGGHAIYTFDVVDKLRSVMAETLVVWGDHDPGTPPEGNRKIASLIPGARSQELVNARHVPNVEYPDIFNGIMMEWLGARR